MFRRLSKRAAGGTFEKGGLFFMWQVTIAGAAAVAAGILFTMQKKKYRRAIEKAKAKKLAELSASGFVFSKEYNMEQAALIVDKPHKQWVLLEYDCPSRAFPRPFSAIEDIRIISRKKIHVGTKSLIGVGAVRKSAQGSNCLENITDALRGVEITLKGEQEEVLFLNTLDGDYSAERVQAIFESLKEQASAGR